MEPLDIADVLSDTCLQTPKEPVISAWAFLDLCQIAESRNIKGAHFAVGCGYSYHHLPKGAPL
jgi:hypothetical protein